MISTVWRTKKKRCTNCLADNNRSEMEKKRYIAIAGNIGAGKSSLTTQLGKSFGWETYYESVEGNPYLSDFYDDMRRWSFNLQIYILTSRCKNQKMLKKRNQSIMQDRTIYENVEMDAKNLNQMCCI